MATTKSYDRSLILRTAWARAKFIAAMVCEPVLRHIGAAMKNCWAIAKGVLPPVEPDWVEQPVQQQQASAAAPVPAPAGVPLDITDENHLSALLVGRSAVLSLALGDVKYTVSAVERWTSTDGELVRDYVRFETEGYGRDDSKGPINVHFVRKGLSRSQKLQAECGVGQVRFAYGGYCDSGRKRGNAETLLRDIFEFDLPATIDLPRAEA